MQTWIALLRGVNVGGKNLLPMNELVAILENLDCKDVRTYIQSGNAAFRSTHRVGSMLDGKISRSIENHFGFKPLVFLLTLNEFENAISMNPYPEAGDAPNSFHVFFLSEESKSPDLEALENLKVATERFKLDGRVFYLHAPDGVGRSRLEIGPKNRGTRP